MAIYLVMLVLGIFLLIKKCKTRDKSDLMFIWVICLSLGLAACMAISGSIS